MIADTNTVTIFDQEIELTTNLGINELVLPGSDCVEIIDPLLKSAAYPNNRKALYFFQKSEDKFAYFYFNVNQVFFLKDKNDPYKSFLFIPDFIVTKFDSLRLLVKEPIIARKVKHLFLDPWLNVKVSVVDCSNLAEMYILLKVLSECENKLISFKSGKREEKNNTLLPAYGKVLLDQADQAFKELIASKKEMSEKYHTSLENWLQAKEKSGSYVGKIHPKFKQFHAFQRECIKLCASSLKTTSIYTGFLFDLFMGAGKTIVSCVWMDFLRDYHNSKTEFIIITPKNVMDQWDEILTVFELRHLSHIFSWDSFNKINDLLKSGKRFVVIADESHYCFGPSARNESFYQLMKSDQILGSVLLTGTPYTGKPGQLVWVARALDHYWGMYPGYFQKQLEAIENCAELVKQELQNCVYSLTLDEALKLYPEFKIPEKDNQILSLDMDDPKYNEDDQGYLKRYENCLVSLAMELNLESINDIPAAMRMRGKNMIISHRILQCLEQLKVDWIVNHSDLPLRMKLGKKMVFFTKYRESAKQLYKGLSSLNDLFHLTEGNYTLKKRADLSIVKLQKQIGELEDQKRDSETLTEKEKIDKQIKHLKSERKKLAFTNAILSKPQEVLDRMKPGDFDLIKSEEMMIDTFYECLIIGGVNPNARKAAMEGFNTKNQDVKFIVCSIDAGGTGLNLQESNCDEVFHTGIGTNYITFEQSLSRVRRCGNESETVKMILLTFEHSTADKLNLEGSLMKIYNIKDQIVKNIKSEELEHIALYHLSESEILKQAADNMGFDDFLVQSADSKLAEYRSVR